MPYTMMFASIKLDNGTLHRRKLAAASIWCFDLNNSRRFWLNKVLKFRYRETGATFNAREIE